MLNKINVATGKFFCMYLHVNNIHPHFTHSQSIKSTCKTKWEWQPLTASVTLLVLLRLSTLLFVWVRTGFLLSSTVLLSLGGKQKIQRTASWNHVLSFWWEKVLVQGRAHWDASLYSSFPRCHRQMQKKQKKQVAILQLCCFSLMRDANLGWPLWSDEPYLIITVHIS